MRDANSYEEWKASAVAADERSGAARWKEREKSGLYDYRVIRRRHDELVEIRASGDPRRLTYYLSEGLHGNMGGMGSPALYTRARFGTKALITRYIDEIVLALHDLETIDEREIDLQEKRALLRRAKDCFGCSALMLSGAGSLGAFHFGVAKALSEQELVPNVVSGASAGSIAAAIIGTHKAQELPQLFSQDAVARGFGVLRGGSPERQNRIRTATLKAMIEAVVPDLTFIEAFEETRRQINVSVAPATLHQRSRLLNASTSPNAFIREAVMASCAVPGVFPPVTLAAKGASGERRPYVPSRQWVDGSITDDLPARRLARLYGANHFISSLANPVVFWASRDPHARESLPMRLAGIARSASQEWLRAVYPATMGLVRNVSPLDIYTRLWFSIMTQDYGADLNILPSRRFLDPRLFLAALSDEEAHALLEDGERATWPKIEIIRNCTRISRCIDALQLRLDARGSAVPVTRRA